MKQENAGYYTLNMLYFCQHFHACSLLQPVTEVESSGQANVNISETPSTSPAPVETGDEARDEKRLTFKDPSFQVAISLNLNSRF